MKGDLQTHMDTLAHSTSDLAFRAKVDEGIIKRALAGQPIPEYDARRIQKYLGLRFGHPVHGAQDYSVDGLMTV